MTPKSLLRHELSVSSLEDLANGEFANGHRRDRQARLPPTCAAWCCRSGKVYFDLLKARRATNNTEVALVRVEQLYPFPVPEMEAVLAKYPNAREVVWCQEEPQNQGAWYQIRHRLRDARGQARAAVRGPRRRPRRRPPASPRFTKREQRGLIEAALTATNKEDGARETKRLTADAGAGRGRHVAVRRTTGKIMAIEIKVPQLPESVADATLVTWHKQAGQAVTRDENLADLETDKVVLEVPAPVNGVLKELRSSPARR